jgi:hypothetical protein
MTRICFTAAALGWLGILTASMWGIEVASTYGIAYSGIFTVTFAILAVAWRKG